jgi:hypothetical protein
MPPITLGAPTVATLNDADLTPHITSVHLEADTVDYADGPEVAEALQALRPFTILLSGTFDLSPAAWRLFTGRQHPWISGMHRTYRRRARGWRCTR